MEVPVVGLWDRLSLPASEGRLLVATRLTLRASSSLSFRIEWRQDIFVPCVSCLTPRLVLFTYIRFRWHGAFCTTFDSIGGRSLGKRPWVVNDRYIPRSEYT